MSSTSLLTLAVSVLVVVATLQAVARWLFHHGPTEQRPLDFTIGFRFRLGRRRRDDE